MNHPTLDIAPYIDPGDDPRQAAKRLAKVFRDGLEDCVSLPEVRTDAGEAAHYLLGCIWHSALGHMVDCTRDLDPEPPVQVMDCINATINDRLYKLAFMVIKRQGPLGPSDRCTLPR